MTQFRVQSWMPSYTQRAIPVEVTVTRGGKSILFLDGPSGVSYKRASQEHRARREGMRLMECEAGHLVTQARTDRTLTCPAHMYPHLLREWRRVM